MSKRIWEPCSILAPVPAVLVTVRGADGRPNVFTVAWTGTVCTKPAMVTISVRKERFSYPILKETGEFVINLTTKKLLRAVDFCGVRSGRDTDKFAELHLDTEDAACVRAPLLTDSPVNLECRVEQVIELGSHDLFLARIEKVDVDERCLDDTGKLSLKDAGLIAYSHGSYYELGKELGTFGYSVRKKPKNVTKK